MLFTDHWSLLQQLGEPAAGVAGLEVSVAEEGGDLPRFGLFECGESVLFVDAWHGALQPVAHTRDAYIHVSGLEALLAELDTRSAPLSPIARWS